MTAPQPKVAEPIGALEPSSISCRDSAAQALGVVRDGVITGEGPTTKDRVHFSRALDALDAAWCASILTAAAVDHQPVSRAEAEALFEINDAAAERSDEGRFDDLMAKAVVHHAASASGLPVPSRTVALRLRRQSKAARQPGQSVSTPKSWSGSPARCVASAAATAPSWR